MSEFPNFDFNTTRQSVSSSIECVPFCDNGKYRLYLNGCVGTVDTLEGVVKFRDQQTLAFYDFVTQNQLSQVYPPIADIPVLEPDVRFRVTNCHFVPRWVAIDDQKVLYLSSFDAELCYAEEGPEY